MNQAQRNKYVETTIQTATPAQMLIMLYDGAIRFSRAALEAIQQQNHQEVHNNLIKVQDIISEFTITLDQSSPMAEGLMQLYEYFLFRLREANIKKQPEPIQEVLGYLIELKEVWIEAGKKVNAQQKTAAASNS